MGKVPFQYRKYFHVLSSSGSCTMAVPSPSSWGVPLPSPALDTRVPQGTALHLQCVFSLMVLNNNSMLMISGFCLFSSGLFPQASVSRLQLRIRLIHLETSRASYTHYVHWWSYLHQTSTCRLISLDGIGTQLDIHIRKWRALRDFFFFTLTVQSLILAASDFSTLSPASSLAPT